MPLLLPRKAPVPAVAPSSTDEYPGDAGGRSAASSHALPLAAERVRPFGAERAVDEATHGRARGEICHAQADAALLALARAKLLGPVDRVDERDERRIRVALWQRGGERVGLPAKRDDARLELRRRDDAARSEGWHVDVDLVAVLLANNVANDAA